MRVPTLRNVARALQLDPVCAWGTLNGKVAEAVKERCMRFHQAILAILVVPLWSASAQGPDAGFERYQIILDRKPFGDAPPPSQAPAATTVPLSESFAKMIRMSALIEQDDGSIRVGLIDMSNNENFFLGEGEIVNGVELVSATYEEEEAVLKKGSEMAVIKLQSGEIQALTPAEQKERLDQSEKRRLSYAERRRQRQERRRKAAAPPPPPPEPIYKGEELQQHLQEYQMEVIRQGLPPLPIPLTEEMDAQLVAEGILPPVE